MRPSGRAPDQMRELTFEPGFTRHAEGSCLVSFGDTRVLCTASVTEGVPRWRKGSGLGWVTAEYAMLPRATTTRNDRESIMGGKYPAAGITHGPNMTHGFVTANYIADKARMKT